MGTNFTSQTLCRAPSSGWVCEACAYITSRTSPVIGRDAKEGKKFGGSFRNYSHLWDERGYVNASKGEKPAIREFLARDHRAPWFAALADSGQKHVLPFSVLNGPGRGGVVLFDEVRVPIPADQSLVDECTALLTAGATKEELECGDYSARATLARCTRLLVASCTEARTGRGTACRSHGGRSTTYGRTSRAVICATIALTTC